MLDWKWVWQVIAPTVATSFGMVMAGSFLWRGHLRAIANDWKEIAEARAGRIKELTTHLNTLEGQVRDLILKCSTLEGLNNALLSRLAAQDTKLLEPRPRRPRSTEGKAT